MDKRDVLGIDLGGTAIKLGRFYADGTCIASLQVPTPQPSTPEAVITAIATAIDAIDPQRQSIAVGIGTPGPADATGRIAKVAINLEGWRDIPLAEQLEAKIQRPVTLANDANCAGLGEAWLGAGKGFTDLLLLTLGTGVGGAVILDGKLFIGRQGTAAELGLITLNPGGPPCNSGNQGSLEQYASVQAIRRQMNLEPVELGQRASQGDRVALEFWENYGSNLGAGLASLIYIFTPEVIVLGGGISASMTFFLPAIMAELKQRVLPSSLLDLQILPAQLGAQAGIVGAAQLALQTFPNKIS
ncbi:MAG: ROK family protein [Cyanobacteria bacterium P01_H01_bin.121]